MSSSVAGTKRLWSYEEKLEIARNATAVSKEDKLEIARNATAETLWRTKSGRLVRQEGVPVFSKGHWKIYTYNTVTSGAHGWLRLDRLEVAWVG